MFPMMGKHVGPAGSPLGRPVLVPHAAPRGVSGHPVLTQKGLWIIDID